MDGNRHLRDEPHVLGRPTGAERAGAQRWFHDKEGNATRRSPPRSRQCSRLTTACHSRKRPGSCGHHARLAARVDQRPERVAQRRRLPSAVRWSGRAINLASDDHMFECNRWTGRLHELVFVNAHTATRLSSDPKSRVHSGKTRHRLDCRGWERLPAGWSTKRHLHQELRWRQRRCAQLAVRTCGQSNLDMA